MLNLKKNNNVMQTNKSFIIKVYQNKFFHKNQDF